MTVKLATGHVTIDPPTPSQLAGYPDRVGNWTAIHDSLEANAVLLRTDQSFVILVSLDLLYCGSRMRREILAQCPEVGSQSLILGASHTHFAPATSDEQPLLGKAEEQYIAMCATRISDLIKRLLREDGELVNMDFRLTEPLRSANRRQPARRLSGLRIRSEILFRPNPEGEVDPRGRVVTFCAAKDGKPLAIIWGWSCHPVCFPRRTEVSSEYPGVVRAKAREVWGTDLPILFFQGFAGNIRPPAIGRSRLQRKKIFVPWSEAEWQDWSSAIAREVVGAVSRGGRTLSDAVSVRIERPLADFVSSAPPERVIGFHGVRLGNDLYFLGVTAEPSVEYIGVLDALVPTSGDVFPIGCLDGTYGYLPTTEQSIEGGYEGAGFLPGFSLPGILGPDIGQKAKASFKDLVAKLASETH
ncbi:MAG: hypothetical protein RL274_522 [Pseudomonadota bacterium]|jgi:hypothetical protein